MAKKFTPIEIDRMVEMYKAHDEVKVIAIELGCTPNNVNYQLHKLRKDGVLPKRPFRQGDPSNNALRRRFGVGIGEMHKEIAKLSVDARIWLHTEAAKQGYKSVAEMTMDHMLEQFYAEGGK